MNSKEEFINKYEVDKILNDKSKEHNFRKKFTLRNVLAFIFFMLGIFALIIYIIVAISYYKYGELYNNFDLTMKTLGLNDMQQNSMLLQLQSIYKFNWVKVYKVLSPYIILFSSINLILSIIFWLILPNFKFNEIIKHLRRK